MPDINWSIVCEKGPFINYVITFSHIFSTKGTFINDVTQLGVKVYPLL